MRGANLGSEDQPKMRNNARVCWPPFSCVYKQVNLLSLGSHFDHPLETLCSFYTMVLYARPLASVLCRYWLAIRADVSSASTCGKFTTSHSLASVCLTLLPQAFMDGASPMVADRDRGGDRRDRGGCLSCLVSCLACYVCLDCLFWADLCRRSLPHAQDAARANGSACSYV